MERLRIRLRRLALAALCAAAPVAAGVAADTGGPGGGRPLVVELFTSQGCSSCPPADAYLGELAGRDGVLALSMHVDYWNALGWKDPFSSPEVTARQRAYANTLGGRYVYTPQMVVGGRAHAVGSDRAKIERLIAEARQAAPRGPDLALIHDPAGRVVVRVGAAPAAGPARLWLVAFDDRHATPVPSGENTGRTLTNSNVVRALRPIGTWSGAAKEVSVDIAAEIAAGYGNCAVLLQLDSGAILAAAAMRLPPGSH